MPGEFERTISDVKNGGILYANVSNLARYVDKGAQSHSIARIQEGAKIPKPYGRALCRIAEQDRTIVKAITRTMNNYGLIDTRLDADIADLKTTNLKHPLTKAGCRLKMRLYRQS